MLPALPDDHVAADVPERRLGDVLVRGVALVHELPPQRVPQVDGLGVAGADVAAVWRRRRRRKNSFSCC